MSRKNYDVQKSLYNSKMKAHHVQEGARRERMKRGSGMNGRVDRSRAKEIRIAEALAKIKPTEPSR
jgi:hypothetical protein